MSGVPADLPPGSAVVLTNPDEDASPEAFRAFIDELLPLGAKGWVPEHFYSQLLGALRRQLLGQKLSQSQASVAVARLGGWHLRHASVAPLVQGAWSYRHNLTAADALNVALAEQLGASFLTDDHRLVQAPRFPSHVPVLRLPGRV